MPDFPKWIETLRQIEPRYRAGFVVMLLSTGVLWYRWESGYRALWQFASDRLFWGVLAIGIIGAWVYCDRYALPTRVPTGQIGILVAPIPGDKHRAQQNSYINAIRVLVSNDPALAEVVQVSLLRRELPEEPEEQHHEAIRLGQRRGYSFVIRPIPEAGGHRPWLTIIDQPEFPREEIPFEKISPAQLAELDRVALPQDITLLARCALALSYYGRELYEEAASQLTQILDAPGLPTPAPARPYLNFLLGNSYSYVRFTDPASKLPLAIAAYDKALLEWTVELYLKEWALTMNNRGSAYGELPGPNRAANLLEAIRAFDESLKVCTRERYPIEWAIAMNNRGNAYQKLPGPDREGNLREAIRCYDEALDVYTRDRYPTEWAMTMNNRGAAHQELPGPEREANLREAIGCYDEALKVRTRERYPTQWAMTTNNRGNAYGQLPGPDREANLRKAIRCYDEALEVYTRDRYPTDWALTMNNRGNAHQELRGPDREANLRKAIRCYDEALEVYTRDRYPTDWALIMGNRGNAHQELPGPDREANLREAVRCYELALEEFEEQRFTHLADGPRRNLDRARCQLAEVKSSA